jgi:hypothetical protein
MVDEDPRVTAHPDMERRNHNGNNTFTVPPSSNFLNTSSKPHPPAPAGTDSGRKVDGNGETPKGIRAEIKGGGKGKKSFVFIKLSEQTTVRVFFPK